MQNGSVIEVAPIGNEGMAGLMAFVGNLISPHDVVVQIPGYGLRIGVDAFQAELNRSDALQKIVTGYHSVCLAQNVYQIACNGLHTVDQRCCRRLLSTQDRIVSDDLPLTHDSLAVALGVRRASVTEELGLLQKRGVIGNRRGHIRILDRPQLQLLACECYQAETDALNRLFG